MRYPGRFAYWLPVAAIAMAWSSAGWAPAQAPTSPPPAAASSSEAEAKAIREQSIYIPYDKLRSVFEQHGRGVFLPYEKFQELWNAARAQTTQPTAHKPPVAAVINEVESEAVAGKDVVRVQAKLKIEVLADGWSEIPLRLGDCAITSAKIGVQPARVVGNTEQGYRLLVFKKEKASEQIELSLDYAKAITKVPGQNSVSFDAPQVPVSRWKVRIPESGVKVNIQPLIAATEVPGEKPAEGKKPADETVVQAFVGAAASVRIEWTPKAEGATGLEVLASVQAEQQVWITEGVARTRAKLAYAISRAELRQLTLEAPADQKVSNVFDPNVRKWSVQASGKTQKITAELFEPAKTAQSLVVELEKFSEDKAKLEYAVPVVRALGVGRQQGVLVVDVASGLRAEATKTAGLLQLDRNDLPQGMAGGNWAFAYRYATPDFELVLSTEKVQPHILADSLVEAYLQAERLTIDVTTVYTVERAGIFRLEIDVPAGFDVRRVAGVDVAGAKAVQVDGHHLEGAKRDRLVVDLARKAMGRVALSVQLHKPLQEAALATPSDKPAEIPVPVPRVTASTVQRATGKVVLYLPESLRVNPNKIDGLRSITFKEAFEPVPATQPSKPGDVRPVLAFAFAADAVQFSLDAQRRKPQATVGQFLTVRVEEGVVKYQSTLFYNVRYSGVKALRVDLPRAIAARVRVTTRGMREKEIAPPPKDVAANDVAWSLAGESELFGSGQIDLAWEDDQGVGKLQIGKSVDVLVPRLAPKDVDRAWGQILLVKTETIDVQESDASKGLRPIDPQHDLMPGASGQGAARAFEFHDDWQLTVTASRYKLEEVKRTSIERAVVQTVLTSAERVSVRAQYRIRSARQRLEVQLPAGVQFDAQPVRINGRPIVLEEGQKGRFFIPLTDPNPDQAFVLELRYAQPDESGKSLDLPFFPQEAAVQKVFLCVYMPERRLLLAERGPWTEEFSWDFQPDFKWHTLANKSDAELQNWVGEGLGVKSAGDAFPVDQQRYLFSTLQPVAPPDGSLHLSILPDRRLTLLVFAVALVLGILLLPACASTRVGAVGVLVIALIVTGLFWPIALRQILDGRLLATTVVVLVLWIVAGFVRRSRRPAVLVATVVPSAAPPAPAPAETPPESPNADQQGGPDHA